MQGLHEFGDAGRGLYGRQITAAYLDGLDEAGGKGRTFTDCHIRNSASIRLFLGSGAFRLVARVRPLTPREQAGRI